MNFYYRSLPDGRCEVVCTRCFLTIGAAREEDEIRRIEGGHLCRACRTAVLQPEVTTHALPANPHGRGPAMRGTLLTLMADCPMRPMVRNAVLLLAAAFALYLLPTAFELEALKHSSPWISSVLLGDVAGCAFLSIVLRKVKAGIYLYCALTMFEAYVCWLHIVPASVLAWFTDLVPTLVVSVTALRLAGHTGKLVTYG